MQDRKALTTIFLEVDENKSGAQIRSVETHTDGCTVVGVDVSSFSDLPEIFKKIEGAVRDSKAAGATPETAAWDFKIGLGLTAEEKAERERAAREAREAQQQKIKEETNKFETSKTGARLLKKIKKAYTTADENGENLFSKMNVDAFLYFRHIYRDEPLALMNVFYCLGLQEGKQTGKISLKRKQGAKTQ